MPEDRPAPLVDLEPAGKPVYLKYDLPDPRSFSARSYIDLDLPREAFREVRPGVAAAPDEGKATINDEESGVRAAPAIQVPDSVSVPADGDPAAPPIVAPGERLTAELAALTRRDVAGLARAGRQVQVYRTITGQLDYRTAAGPPSPGPRPAGRTARTAALLPPGPPDPPEPGDGGGTWTPSLHVFIDSPAGGSGPHTGPASGLTLTVSGRWTAPRLPGVPAVEVTAPGATAAGAVQVNHGRFRADLRFPASGQHTVTVRGTIEATGTEGEPVTVTDTATATVRVELDATDPAPPATPPAAVFESPADRAILLTQHGIAKLPVRGRTTAGAGRTVTVVQLGTGEETIPVKPAEDGTWAAEVVLSGAGERMLSAVAVDDRGVASQPARWTVSLSDQLPFRRLLSRLLLVETLTMSVMPSACAPGRVVRTMSLAPGEKTQISVKSYTRTETERKEAASIVDSNATECVGQFTQALQEQQSSTAAHAEAQNYKINGSAEASWGWGRASISGEYSGSANSTRQETTANVLNAVRVHSDKASANRTVTVNTESRAQQQSGTEESVTREIANINASCALTVVFRQLNQAYLTVVHLTNVRVAFYTEDLMLDAQGRPQYLPDPDPVTKQRVLDIRRTYREVSLPELDGLLLEAVGEDYRERVRRAILHALSGIPDHQDRLQRAYESVVPTAEDGTPVPAGRYLRFPRDLRTTVVDPMSGRSVEVPGIVLAHSHVTNQTDSLVASMLLDPGNGLDPYSRNLQAMAIEEQRIGIAERQAALDRQALARRIVAEKDEAAAAVFAKVFPATAAAPGPAAQPVPAPVPQPVP